MSSFIYTSRRKVFRVSTSVLGTATSVWIYFVCVLKRCVLRSNCEQGAWRSQRAEVLLSHAEQWRSRVLLYYYICSIDHLQGRITASRPPIPAKPFVLAYTITHVWHRLRRTQPRLLTRTSACLHNATHRYTHASEAQKAAHTNTQRSNTDESPLSPAHSRPMPPGTRPARDNTAQTHAGHQIHRATTHTHSHTLTVTSLCCLINTLLMHCRTHWPHIDHTAAADRG